MKWKITFRTRIWLIAIPILASACKNVDSRDISLLNAVRSENVQEVRNLISRGAKVNALPVLQSAAETGNREMVQILLDAGADVNRRDASGNTPISRALIFEKGDIAKLLLQRGATLYEPEEALIFAILLHDAELVRTLLEKGVRANATGNGDSALTLVVDATLYSSGIAQVLLDHGADPNFAGPNGITPLLAAARHSYAGSDLGFAELLLARGADPNVGGKDGTTPLLETVKHTDNYHVVLFSMLLQKGANPNARTRSGETPLSVASDPFFINLLRQAGAKDVR